MIIGWSLSSSGLELDVAGHGCGVAVELGRLRGVSSSVPARGSDCVSQDPSHDGVDKSGVDEGDVVEVRLVPEFEGWRLLGVYALCVCVDSSGCAVGLVVGDVFYQLEERFAHAAVGVHHEWDEFLVRSERSLLVLAVFDRLRGLDDVGFGMALALAGLGLARRVLSLADDVCDRGVEQEGCIYFVPSKVYYFCLLYTSPSPRD